MSIRSEMRTVSMHTVMGEGTLLSEDYKGLLRNGRCRQNFSRL